MLNTYVYIMVLFLHIRSNKENRYCLYPQHSKLVHHVISDSNCEKSYKPESSNLMQRKLIPINNDCLPTRNICLSNETCINNDIKHRPYVPNLCCTDEQEEQSLHLKNFPIHRPIHYPTCRKDKRPFFPQNCPPCPTEIICKTSQEVISEINGLLVKKSTQVNSVLKQVKSNIVSALTTELTDYETLLGERLTFIVDDETNLLYENLGFAIEEILLMYPFFDRASVFTVAESVLPTKKASITAVMDVVVGLADTEIISTLNDITTETGLLPQIIEIMDTYQVSITDEMTVKRDVDLLVGALQALDEGIISVISDVETTVFIINTFFNKKVSDSMTTLIPDVTEIVLQAVTDQSLVIKNFLRNYGNDLKAIASDAINCFKGETVPNTQVFGIESKSKFASLVQQNDRIRQMLI